MNLMKSSVRFDLHQRKSTSFFVDVCTAFTSCDCWLASLCGLVSTDSPFLLLKAAEVQKRTIY